MKNKQKRISTLIFFIIIIILPLITTFSKKKSFSETENRPLQEKPSLSIESWFDKSFMNQSESYVADHFTGRIKWISSKINMELMLGKTNLNNVYITDSRMLEKIPQPDYSVIDKSISAINDFANSNNVPVFVMMSPTSAGIYSETLPENTPQINQREIINYIYKNLDTKVSAVDVYDLLYAMKDDYIYYRTDHHWTSLGAYYAYSVAIQKLGFTSIAYSKYNIEHASNNFLGTYYSKTLYDKIQSDTIDIYSYNDGDTVVSCTVDNGIEKKEYNDIYFRDFLKGKDKYSTYLGTNQPEVVIKTNLESNKKILIFKDSYGNSFIPFLTQHYNQITVLDMRYVKDYKEYVNVSDYSQVLFLYNSTTFCEDENIKKIAY